MNDLEARLSQIEQRLKLTEDELELRNLMVRYGLAVDCGDVETALACHSDNAIYTVSSPTTGRDDMDSGDLHLSGHQAIADMLKSDMHQSLVPNCAHTVGPFTIELNGDIARATGYSRLYHRKKDDFNLMRLSVNEWQFIRDPNGWLITARESRLIGESEAQTLLASSAFYPASYNKKRRSS
jgi:hypothetical protein